MRAEYRFHNGLVLPNSFTDAGLDGILKGALRNEWPAGGLFVGLCSAVPSRGLTLADLQEPTVGVNGYARLALARSAVAWPTAGTQNGDPFLETEDQVFTATGGPFDKGIFRMFLTDQAVATAGNVWALSAALQVESVIDVATPVAERTFNYRVYGV